MPDDVRKPVIIGRLVAVLLILAAVPLALSLILFGHSSWTSQWPEIPVAFGWSAPRYPWVEEVLVGPAAASQGQPLALEKLFLDPPEDDAARAAHLHGLWLIIRERREPFGCDPMKLVWWSGFSADARQLLAESWDTTRFGRQFQSALSGLPHDAVLQADLLPRSFDPFQLGDMAEQAARRDSRGSADGDASRDAATAGLWPALLDAGRVLQEQPGVTFPLVYVQWIQWGNVPSLHAGIRTSDAPSLDEAGNAAYADALERLSSLPAEEYLETPLEDRVERAWRTLGLQPNMAGYAARNSRSSSALAVGRQCAQHLELLEKLIARAIDQDELEDAARWIELEEKVAIVFEQSVHSTWLYNYFQKKHGAAGANAQIVQGHNDCPADVAARMAVIVARSPTITPRLAPSTQVTMRAFCLDNLARSCLRTSGLALTAALIGWLHLRRKGSREGTRQLPDPMPRRSLVVAAAALLIVFAAFAGLEVTNLLGERMASFSYAVVLVAILMAITGRIGWLVVSELVVDPDLQRQRLRRRMVWLIGSMVLLFGMRPLIGRGMSGVPPVQWIQALENSTGHTGLPALLSLFFGILIPVLTTIFAVQRWRRDPLTPPMLHPFLLVVLSLWFGVWVVLSSPGEWLRGRQPPPADFGGDWSQIMDTVSVVGSFFQGPLIGMPSYTWGWNLLTISIAGRLTNLGLWFVLACTVLWPIVLRRPSRAAWFSHGELSTQDPQATRRICLVGITWSCLWLGLVSLAVHAWCTLGVGYYVSFALAQM